MKIYNLIRILRANNNIILEDLTNWEAGIDNRQVPTPTKPPKTHTMKVEPSFVGIVRANQCIQVSY